MMIRQPRPIPPPQIVQDAIGGIGDAFSRIAEMLPQHEAYQRKPSVPMPHVGQAFLKMIGMGGSPGGNFAHDVSDLINPIAMVGRAPLILRRLGGAKFSDVATGRRMRNVLPKSTLRKLVQEQGSEGARDIMERTAHMNEAVIQRTMGRRDAVDSVTGLPLNEDGTVTLFHHTDKGDAVRKSGKLVSEAEPRVYVTTHRGPNIGYGDDVVSVDVDPKKLVLDDEFPDGRKDFAIESKSAEFKQGGRPAVAVDLEDVNSRPQLFRGRTEAGEEIFSPAMQGDVVQLPHGLAENGFELAVRKAQREGRVWPTNEEIGEMVELVYRQAGAGERGALTLETRRVLGLPEWKGEKTKGVSMQRTIDDLAETTYDFIRKNVDEEDLMWYDFFNTDIRGVVGHQNLPEFSAVFSYFSPKTAVENNLANALQAMMEYRRHISEFGEFKRDVFVRDMISRYRDDPVLKSARDNPIAGLRRVVGGSTSRPHKVMTEAGLVTVDRPMIHKPFQVVTEEGAVKIPRDRFGKPLVEETKKLGSPEEVLERLRDPKLKPGQKMSGAGNVEGAKPTISKVTDIGFARTDDQFEGMPTHPRVDMLHPETGKKLGKKEYDAGIRGPVQLNTRTRVLSGSGIEIGPDKRALDAVSEQIEKVADFYHTGVFRGDLKTTSFFLTLAQKADEGAYPFITNDVMMGEVFQEGLTSFSTSQSLNKYGFNTTGGQGYRVAQAMQHAVAKDISARMGTLLSPEQVQAILWAIEKRRKDTNIQTLGKGFETMYNVKAGTIGSARAFSTPQIRAMKQMGFSKLPPVFGETAENIAGKAPLVTEISPGGFPVSRQAGTHFAQEIKQSPLEMVGQMVVRPERQP